MFYTCMCAKILCVTHTITKYWRFYACPSEGWRAFRKIDGKIKRRALVKSPCVLACDLIEKSFVLEHEECARAKMFVSPEDMICLSLKEHKVTWLKISLVPQINLWCCLSANQPLMMFLWYCLRKNESTSHARLFKKDLVLWKEPQL